MNAKTEGSDSFFWVRKFLKTPNLWPSEPWIVFCCPPYAMFEDQTEELTNMIESLQNAAPQGSLIVVETGEKFDLRQLPSPDGWRSRLYSPAVISIFSTLPDED